jgi:ABC-2 type transport system ATP-binding protein
LVPMIEAQALTKSFGGTDAVRDVSFSVHKGEVLGFLGPNGAGKSTTMKMITGFLAPTRGTARVCGHDILTQTRAAQRRLGYLPEGAPAYGDMTPFGLLSFVADVRGLSGANRKKRIEAALDAAQVRAVVHQPIDTLSKGFKRRVGLAQALLHDPDVLILDEPTDGLDPNQKHDVRTLIREMAAEKAILISTHILEEVEALCSRTLVIARGGIVADSTPADLLRRDPLHGAVVLAVVLAARAALLPKLHLIPGALTVAEAGGEVIVRPVPGREADLLANLTQAMRAENWPVTEVYQQRGRLDVVFRALTTNARTPAPTTNAPSRAA